MRVLGFVSALALAGGAWFAGALPAGHRTGPAGPYTAGLVVCLLGLAGLIAAWLLIARRPPSRGLLLTGVLWQLPVLFAPPLGSRDVYSYACQGWVFAESLDPYAVSPRAAECPWLPGVATLWQDATTPYGPFALLLSGAAAASGSWLVALTVLRLLAVAGLALTALGVHRLARSFGLDPRRAVWLALPAPLIAVHATSGAHHDALLAGLVVAALALGLRAGRAPLPAGTASYAPGITAPGTAGSSGALGSSEAAGSAGAIGPSETAGSSGAAGSPEAAGSAAAAVFTSAAGPSGAAGSAGAATSVGAAGATAHAGAVGLRPAGPVAVAVVAGVALGLAAAIKITALAALPFVLILAARTALRRTVAVVAGLVGSFALVSLVSGLGLGWLAALTESTGPKQWTSIPTGVGMAAGYLLRPLGLEAHEDTALAVARLAGLVALAVIATSCLWTAWRRRADPRAVVLRAGYVLLALVLLGPVAYPWYFLTPVPVLAAALVTDRHLRRLALGAALAALLVLPDGLGIPSQTKAPGAIADLVLVIAAAVVAIRRRASGTRHG
ncbi:MULTISPECIES: polyprenol phosphomannose-dependent alpha 1,6 mannosyltransferase MptB [Catenuloplanes]|uniref:DUF2029 domain-containing protein n=1 Tax=Catenuloplanes niger TaxID=587534 RepID=A0AAE4CUU7_9ACTN|nr:polyprenol phosphomannose-dependent alpha 1,6 mannosyltransferase MptB [Catenuloplanes niger]MDR7326741.1 hypothetical protein [Catenuloplanes niger]